MIDFRTHLISIIAIFFALATGIALGAGPLKGDIDEQLRQRTDQLATQNADLRDQVSGLQRQDEFRVAFVEQVAPRLLAGQLTGRSVVVVQLPGTEGDTVDALATALGQAGARTTGRIEVTDAWLDPEQESVLDTLAAQLVSPGVTLPDGSAYERAATVLANALVSTAEETPGAATGDAQTVLAALQEAGLVDAPDQAPPPAELAILVAGPTPAEGTAGSEPLVALASAFDAAGKGTVLAGPASAAAEGGALFAVREDQGLAADISTVDAADVASGVVAAIYALAEQLRGQAGHYGYVGTTDGPLPAATRPSP